MKTILSIGILGILMLSCSNGKKGSWETSFKTKFIKECETNEKMSGLMPDKEKFCKCVADKIEAEFDPNDSEAMKNDKMKIGMLTLSCMDLPKLDQPTDTLKK